MKTWCGRTEKHFLPCVCACVCVCVREVYDIITFSPRLIHCVQEIINVQNDFIISVLEMHIFIYTFF